VFFVDLSAKIALQPSLCLLPQVGMNARHYYDEFVALIQRLGDYRSIVGGLTRLHVADHKAPTFVVLYHRLSQMRHYGIGGFASCVDRPAPPAGADSVSQTFPNSA